LRSQQGAGGDPVDGDRFQAAFRTAAGDAGYLWYFDFDGDGRDNGQSNRLFGR
jgi:hypothetical protein